MYPGAVPQSSRVFVAVAIVLALVGAAMCTRTKPEPRGQQPAASAPEPTSASAPASAIAPAFAPASHAASAEAIPLAPRSLTAKAVSPFAVRLAWDADAAGARGFEIQIQVGAGFVRAGLVDPTKREFLHHLRLPRQVITYRVRAFNSQGVSEPSSVATLTMPERVEVPGAKVAAMGPCVPMPTKAPPSSGCDPDISRLDANTGRVVFNVPGAGNGCMRHLMGEVAGCTRELGVFELQADIVIVKDHMDEGWPLLHAIAGAGQYAGAHIQTLRFSRGGYTIVDEARVCGESEPGAKDPKQGIVSDDLERCSPPFDSCQHNPTAL